MKFPFIFENNFFISTSLTFISVIGLESFINGIQLIEELIIIFGSSSIIIINSYVIELIKFIILIVLFPFSENLNYFHLNLLKYLIYYQKKNNILKEFHLHKLLI